MQREDWPKEETNARPRGMKPSGGVAKREKRGMAEYDEGRHERRPDGTNDGEKRREEALGSATPSRERAGVKSKNFRAA